MAPSKLLELFKYKLGGMTFTSIMSWDTEPIIEFSLPYWTLQDFYYSLEQIQSNPLLTQN